MVTAKDFTTIQFTSMMDGHVMSCTTAAAYTVFCSNPSSSLAHSRRGPLRRSMMTASDSVSPHIGWERWLSSRIWSSHRFGGWPGRCFHERSGGRPRDKSTWQLRAWCTGTLLGILAMWPKMAFLHLTMWSITGGRPVWIVTSALRIRSCHLMPSIWHWHFIWKLSKILASSARTVHVSAAYRRVERMSALYVRILIVSDRHLSRQILDKDAITDEARAIRLLMSGRHWPSECWTLPSSNPVWYNKLKTPILVK